MKIFLDSSNIQDIQKLLPLGIIDGITTNPTTLSKTKQEPKKVIQELCALLPEGDISVEITEQEPTAAYKQALTIAKIAKNITVKVPCHAHYYPVIKQLVEEKIPVNVTLVFTLVQALLMCKLQVKYISPFIGRSEDIAVDSIQLLDDMRMMVDQYGYETQILAASLRTISQFHDAIRAGADVATLPPELLEKSIDYVLTNQGIAQFNADWQKLGIKQFP